MKNIDSINDRPVTPRIVISTVGQQQKNNFPSPGPKPKSKKILKKILLGIIFIIIILLGIVALRAANLSDKIFVGQKTTFFGKIVDIIRGGGDNAKLTGEDLGQINILLLGIGGEGHDGPYLSDTIILAEIRPDIGQVALISIPRDYWVTLPNGGQSKINEAFSDGYTKKHDWDEGGKWARQVVENLTGQQIPYFAVMDFSGFKKAIDQVNGVDVTVDRTFTDYSYPNDATNGYLPPLTFTAGLQHMDGTKALEFSRSRHAAGVEGSDFSRSQRQQKIIQAFKQKVLSLNLISDAGTINSLLGNFADHFHTNISPSEILHIYNLTKQKNINDFISLSLDPSTSLICPFTRPDSGAYTLVPCQGKSEYDIKTYFKNAFTYSKVTSEKSVIWLSTSTGKTAAYQAAYNKLTQAGLTVWELPYKGQPLAKNIFYQANAKPATAKFIKDNLNASEASVPPPGVDADKTKVDTIIILGGED